MRGELRQAREGRLSRGMALIALELAGTWSKGVFREVQSRVVTHDLATTMVDRRSCEGKAWRGSPSSGVASVKDVVGGVCEH